MMLHRTIPPSLFFRYIGPAVSSRMASAQHNPRPKRNLIFVIGPTGAGKSKLAVQLAQRFNGEIINADAIQLYAGLPIVTNKISECEQGGVRHHLLGLIGLEHEPWTVREFVHEATRIVEEIRGRGKVPVVVGGTGYYVFSLLFRDSTVQVGGSGDEGGTGDEVTEKNESQKEKENQLQWLYNAPTDETFAKLKEVDPQMARIWHPNDRRKIQRSLEIWITTGRKASEIYEEQRRAKNAAASEDENFVEVIEDQEKLRYDPLIFWLDADDVTLKQRLNARVETMVDQGLLEEVKTMREVENDCKERSVVLDQTKGIWVAIGYKELAPWLDAVENTAGDEGDEQMSKKLAKLKFEGIEAVKAGTRQYAKRQNRWIRIRLAKALQDVQVLRNLFLLDCTDLTIWNETVNDPAVSIVESFLSGKGLPDHRTLSMRAEENFHQMQLQDDIVRQTCVCDICNTTLMNQQEWEKHLKSRSHKRVLEAKRKRAQREAYFSKVETDGG